MLASFQPPPPDQLQLMLALARNQEQTDRFLGVNSGSVPFQDFFAPANIQRIMAAGQPA